MTRFMDLEHMPTMPPELREAMASRVARAEGILATVKRLDSLGAWLGLEDKPLHAAWTNPTVGPLLCEAETLLSTVRRSGYERNLDFLKAKVERFKNLTWGQVHYYSMDTLIHEWGRAFDEAINAVYIPDLTRLWELRRQIDAALAVKA